ncbi:unnamed protein product [Phyllotreta striolata]|uniref:Arginine/serine-rich protein PNISR n=1 Tax=Phyllotreta striolata TaxID=444603 RepID=A0A9N9TKM8_PHYSR|nr:unnamed protein product [Phyllotreta striolata]
MYSGSDSNESQKYANWALNPSNYKNVPGEQVDWAALAQQWIIMKEAGPPPIPGEQPVLINKKPDNNEGGEAEMDVENDKEGPPPPAWGPNDPPSLPPGVEPWNWPQQNQTWTNWGNPNWIPPSGVPPPVPNLTLNAAKTPLLPTPPVNNSFTEPPESSSDNATPFGSANSEFNANPYWNNSSGSHKHIKPHNKRYSKVNVPIRASAPLPPIAVPAEPAPPQPQQTSPTIDTAKRKQLPAWIREGLEKMEKDKLKQMERQQKEKEERDTEIDHRSKQTSEDTIEILKTTIRERQKSRFESDEENSVEVVKKTKKPHKEEPPVVLSHEELMLKVRKTMTEILLTVTNRLIEGVCKEELQRYLKHNKASEAASAPSAVNLRGRLGLGIYGGDDSGSSSTDASDDDERDVKNSDDELRDTIKKKMAEFQKTEREIEHRLEEAERQKIGSASRSSTPESNDNDSQVEARPQGRKSKPKSKQRSSSSSSSPPSDYSNNKSKTSHRSSSSDSKDSSYRRKSSKKRSVTPKRRRSEAARRPSNAKRRPSSGRKSAGGAKRRSRSRSRSTSYKKRRRSRSRERPRRSRSSSRSRYSTRRSPSSSRSDRRKRRRSRSESSGRGKRSYRH